MDFLYLIATVLVSMNMNFVVPLLNFHDLFYDCLTRLW